MRKLFFSFCLTALFSNFFAQINRYPLEIKTDDKVSNNGFSYWQKLQIISKDTSFEYHLHTTYPDVIKNLKAGTYTVTLSSLFNHRTHKKITLNKKTSLIKFAGLSSYYTKTPENLNLSEKLKLNDTLYIIFNSNKDEALKEKLALTKTKIGYTVIQYKGISNEVFQEMKITEATYKAVEKFEAECKKANITKSEAAAEMYIELNKELSTFIVPTQWNGFNSLKAVLLLVEQK